MTLAACATFVSFILVVVFPPWFSTRLQVSVSATLANVSFDTAVAFRSWSCVLQVPIVCAGLPCLPLRTERSCNQSLHGGGVPETRALACRGFNFFFFYWCLAWCSIIQCDGSENIQTMTWSLSECFVVIRETVGGSFEIESQVRYFGPSISFTFVFLHIGSVSFNKHSSLWLSLTFVYC